MVAIGIVVGLLILVMLVVVHELGHAIVARRNGVVVEEFGIGFPPKAWSKKLKNGVLFTLNWLPLGGFVRLKGEHDAASGKGTYGAASFWAKTKILFAGVVMNFLVAVFLLTILAWTGLPKIIDGQFSIPSDTRITTSAPTLASILPNSPASAAGFQTGDEILAVDGEHVANASEFIDATRERAGQIVAITYEREGAEQTQTVSLEDSSHTAVFGAGIGQSERIHATWSAPIVGIATTGQLSWETLRGLGELLGNLGSGLVGKLSGDEATRQGAQEKLDTAANSVAGPVGILGVIFPTASQQGPTQLVLLTAVVSLTLAVMNALPIPALDGGRWWTMALFRVFGKKLTKEREETIQSIGFLVLLVLIVTITIADVGKLW